MLTEKKKTILIIILTVSALLIDIIILLDFILRGDVGFWSFNWLREVGFFRWGWLFVFGFAGSAIVGTLYWKPGSPILRGIIIFFSIIALILAAMWSFLLLLVANLPA